MNKIFYCKSFTFFFCLLYFIPSNLLTGQTISGDVTISTQQQADNFNYTVVEGILTIEEETPGNITNLNGLSQLEYAGTLQIKNNLQLKNLEGLSGLTAVEDIHIEGNPALTDITVFNNLHSFHRFRLINNPLVTSLNGLLGTNSNYWFVDEVVLSSNASLTDLTALNRANWIVSIEIDNNASLENLDALGNLGTVTTLILSNNPAVTNIDGLSNLNSAVDISITNNDALTNIDGLFTLSRVQNLLIDDNNALYNLNGLRGITGCSTLQILNNDLIQDVDFLHNLVRADLISIEDNQKLANLDGLKSLRQVEQELRIANNPALTDITALSGTYVNGSLTLADNIQLSEFCGCYLTASNPGFPGNQLYIYGNAANPDREAIIEAGPCSENIFYGDAVMGSQGDIDGFNYTKITGSLIIACPGISNLHGLSELDSIGGDLVISRSSNLYDISGLRHLKSIGGKLNLYGNKELTVLFSLQQLKYVGDSVIIEVNRNLVEFCGLYTLFSSGYKGGVKIQRNGNNPTVQDILTAGSCSNDIYDGDLTITSQTEVDTFHYSFISGSLTIQENQAGNIKNLDRLLPLERVNGLFILNNFALKNLHGLNNLAAAKIIHITNNGSLTDINALVKIKKLASLRLESNSALRDINGLSGLTEVTDQISLTNNLLVKNVDAFFGLKKLPYLYLNGNGITNLNGFADVDTARSDIWIHYNNSLNNISGLSNLKYVNGGFDLVNSKVTNLDALSSLTFVKSFLYINENTLLTNLNGLSNLTNAVTIRINYNDNLSQFCGLYKVLSSTTAELFISNNAVNPSRDEIINGGGCSGINAGLTAVAADPGVPSAYALSQNFPNPFNPGTIIKYDLPEAALVSLKIYNTLGQLVKTLINQNSEAGYHQVYFDAAGLPSGIYFYKLETGGYTKTNKMMLLK